MSIKHTTFLTGLLFLLLSALSAQGFLRTEGKEIVNEAGEPYLLKGMGLGGWMLQEGYMLQTAGFANAQHQLIERMEALVGEEVTNEFYAAWRANHTNENDIEAMHQAGFNSVRLPMHYNLFTLPIEDEPVAGQQTWLEEGFELTDSLIAWCKRRDMYVILDLHAAPGGQGNDQGISD
ncbi:MAG: cellulase family glycosylhydrolase, partial [Bacteroidota bacterium]